MTQATAEHSEAATEQADDQFESDLLTGYAYDDPDDSPTTTQEESADASAPTETKPAEIEQTPEPEPPADELTTALKRIDTLEANHKKYSDDVFGRVGSLEQVLKAQARTPAGQKVQVKIEDYGEFGEEYPEFAKAQIKVINDVLGKLELTGLSHEFTAKLISDAGSIAETAAEKRLTQLRAKEARTDLNETHPGWETIVGIPEKDLSEGGQEPDTEYRRWLKTQPAEYAERVLNSYSPIVIGRSLDKFAQWQDAQKPKPKLTTPSSGGPSRREQQLRSAVTARTTGTTPRPKKEMTEDEAMQAAFEGRL